MTGHQKTHMTKTKYKILETMFLLLEKKDFDEITIDDICISADLSRSTFYRYFEDKYDVVLQYVNHFFLQPLDLFAPETMCEYFNHLLTIESSLKQPIIRLLKYPGNAELQLKMYDLFVTNFINHYKNAFTEDEKIPVITEMIAQYTCSGVTNLISWWFQQDSPISKETVACFITQMIEAPLLLSRSSYHQNE